MASDPTTERPACRRFCIGEDCPLQALGWLPARLEAVTVIDEFTVLDGPFAETKEMIAAQPTRRTRAPDRRGVRRPAPAREEADAEA